MNRCTPGPWRFDEATGCIFAGAGVPTRPVGYAAAGRPETIVNGYLMAASSDLLAALRVALEEVHHPGACRHDHGEDIVAYLEAAIAKATT